MAKAKRQIEEKLKLVDMVIEIIDSRVPYSSHNPMLEKITQNKPRVIIMSKTDMADKSKTDEWVNYYESLGYLVFATNLNNFTSSALTKIKALAEETMKEKRERDARRGIRKRSIKAMILGIPNVGKSTLINKLAKKQSAKVGNKPGVTKAQQ
jgi:ribosome biogenesis GTPase A